MFQRLRKLILVIMKEISEWGNVDANKNKYVLLSPICLGEKERERYSAEFRIALNHPDAKNIALSGAYGAGKSSVALTIEKDEAARGRKWIHVSLADFDGVSDERSVEDEILSQLVYRVPPSALSKSRLKPLRDSSRVTDTIRAVLVVLFVLDTVLIVRMLNGGTAACPSGISSETAATGAAVIWLALAAYAVYREIRTKSVARTFKRLKFLNAEVELFGGEGDTSLDRYMDDIVYVLKKSKVDVVVFEDIDRFNNLTVFEKLRRINDLANEGRRKTLRFIYLVKDSLFADPHDRTKFFDFIIPVIPAVDPTNSADLLRRGLRAGGLDVDEKFLYQLSSFVDDPRILKEICNESVHYRESLFPGDDVSRCRLESLVGIVSYKVIFPEDYENLQKGCGYVHSLFAKKEKLVDDLIKHNRDEVSKCQDEIGRIKETLRLNENELKLLYLCVRGDVRQFDDFQYAESNASTEPAEFFESLRCDQNQRLSHDLEQIQNGNTKYSERLKEIRKTSDSASAKCKRQIEELERCSSEYSRMTLSELIQKNVGGDNFFAVLKSDLAREKDYEGLGIGRVMESRYLPLIRFLVSQGWLNETYPRYMSNQYPDSMLPDDRDFVNSVLGAEAPRSEYKIANPEAVAIRLDQKTVARPSARNYSLLAGLLTMGDARLAEAMIGGVGHDGDSGFVAGFLSSDHSDQSVFPFLDESYPEWAVDMVENAAITDGQKRASLREAFLADHLPSAVTDNAQLISEHVSSDPAFLSAPISNPDRFMEALDRVSYCPNDIDVEACDGRVLETVIGLGMYVPEARLVSKLYGWKYENGEPSDLSGLDELLRMEESGVIRGRVMDEIDLYVESLVSGSQSLLLDGQEAIEMVLGAENLSAAACSAYVDALASPVRSLSGIESDEFAQIVVEAGRMAATVANLLCAHKRFGFEDGLERFIADCGLIEADADGMKSPDVRDDARSLLEDCLLSDALDVDAVERVARSFGCSFADVSLPDGKFDKVESMIDLRVLDMTEHNLKSIRNYYPSLAVRLAVCDLESYADLVCGTEEEDPRCPLLASEAVEIFKDSNADLAQKMRIAEALDDDVSLSPDFPDAINICLIERNRFESYGALVGIYSQSGDSLREAIRKVVASNPDEFVEDDMPGELENLLLESASNGPRADRVEFAARRIGSLVGEGDRARARSILRRTGLTDYVKLIDGPSSMIESTPDDDYMLDVLTDIGMCGTVSERVNDEGKRKVSSLGYRRK